MAAPLIESADCTESGNNTADTTPDVSYPAYVSGDLIILHLASDRNLDHSLPSAGPNSETIVNIITDYSNGVAAGPVISACYFIGSTTTASGTLAFGISGSGQAWQATTVKVLAGEFNATTPIDSVIGSASSSTNASFVDSPAWTTSSGVTDGRIVAWLSRDTDPINATPPTGWENLTNTDVGFVSGALVVRTATVGASASIAAARWASLSDTWASLGYVVNEPASGSTNTPITRTFSGVGTSSLTKTVDYAKAFTYSGVGTQTIGKAVALPRTYSGVGTPTVVKGVALPRTFSGVGTASLVKGLGFEIASTFSGVGTATLTKSLGVVISAAFSAIATSTVGKAVAKVLNFVGVGTSVLTHDGAPSEPDFMDGVMTEEEWFARRRKQYWHRFHIVGWNKYLD